MAEITVQYLYQKYKNDVYSYLISLTHDKTLSEDLTSETFLGAIKTLSKYKGEADIKTWLFSIARFKWYEYIRKNKIQFTDNDLLDIYAVSEINIEKDFVNHQLVASNDSRLLVEEHIKTCETCSIIYMGETQIETQMGDNAIVNKIKKQTTP